MKHMNSIVHFEIPVNDVERAKKFYEKIFGWQIDKFPMPDGDYYVVRTTEVDKNMKPASPGINGGMMQRKDPAQPFMNYINVESIDHMLKSVESHGGKVCLPKQAIGDMGWIAGFIDPEGNIMGLHEENKKHVK